MSEDPNQPAPAPQQLPHAPQGRSPQNLQRLAEEWQHLQRAFAYHPRVRITPLSGSPPDQYQVEYRVRTLAIDSAGELNYIDAASVHIWIPPDYPHEPALVRPISGLFHPNISADGIALDLPSGADTGLVDVIAAVGAMLAYQDYDPENVANPAAMEWAAAHGELLPLDADADFSPAAGGEPLARLSRMGPRTIEQVRSQLKNACDALLSADAAAGIGEIRPLCRRSRAALAIFLEGDIPEDLRGPARELDELARQLPTSLSAWSAIRRSRAGAAAALDQAKVLRDVAESLRREVAAIGALAGAPAPSDPQEILKRIPPLETMQMHLANLASLVPRAQRLLRESRPIFDRLATSPATPGAAFAPPLKNRIDAESARAGQLVDESQKSMTMATGDLQSEIDRASSHGQALQHLARWREYVDLADRARQLSASIVDWGAVGAQTIFVDNASGRSGPFDLEQPLPNSDQPLIVSNLASSAIQVILLETGQVLAESPQGKVTLPVTDPATGKVRSATISLTGNCSELALQLGYLMRESGHILSRLHARVAAPEGWLGAFLDVLSKDSVRRKLRAAHAADIRRWRALRDDMRALAPLKERLATFHLLQNQCELVQRLTRELTEAQRDLAAAEDRIAVIVAGSQKDLETGRLLVPQKWASEYAQLLSKREQLRAHVNEIRQRLESSAAEIRQRVQRNDLLGHAEPPILLSLGGYPEQWDDVSEMNDEAIAALLNALERHLQKKLMPEGWPPPDSARPPERAPWPDL